MCYSILVEQDLKTLEKDLRASADWAAFHRYQKLSDKNAKVYKPLQKHPRIYPYYFAPIIVNRQGTRSIIPMRYRLRPSGSENEVPQKYNLYNARLEGLVSRATWRPLIGKQHGILIHKGFYEWVQDDKAQKKVIFFYPNQDQAWIATPVLYDIWVSPDRSSGFASFAVITRDPFPEVAAAGHDRSPIVLQENHLGEWLDAGRWSAEAAHQWLQQQDPPVTFSHRDAPA